MSPSAPPAQAVAVPPPRVSVVMPVYNAGRFLAEAVSSVLRQTLGDFEFVIVDDGSTDGSRESLERWALRDPRIRLTHQSNRGLVTALNVGLEHARGQYIARMDADDVALPQRLAKQVEYLEQHPDCVAVGARIEMMTPDGLPVGEMYNLVTHEQIDSSNLLGRCAIAHPTAMIRGSALARVGPYRGAFAEDLDMWLRLGEVGRLANLPEVLLRYRLNLGSLSNSSEYPNAEILWGFVREARTRRGLPNPPEPPPIPAPVARSHGATVAAWARAALHGGNFKTARILSRCALSDAPADTSIWATALLAHAGPLGRALLRRRIPADTT